MFFPPSTFDDTAAADAFIAGWFSKHLLAMGEPSLWEASAQPQYHAYRFLWLRTFNNPIVVRLDIALNGTGTLTARRLDGSGGYEPGHLAEDSTGVLPAATVAEFLARLERMGYWEMPTQDEHFGLDGAQWVLEGVRERGYHLVNRWSPDEGAFRNTALFLLDLANLQVDEVY